MSAEKMYDAVDEAFDQMIEAGETRKISGVGLIAADVDNEAKEIAELVKAQSETLKNKVAEFAYKKSSQELKQISLISATVAELIYEAMSGSPSEEAFYEKFKQVMGGKRNSKTKESESIEKQLEEWLSKQQLPIKNEEGQLEMWNFQACMLTNTFIRPTITLTRPDRTNMLTIGLYEVMKNLGQANVSWEV